MMHPRRPPRHVIWIHGREYPCYRDLFEAYLVQHPRRREALALALPSAAERLCGVWSVGNGGFVLERMWLKDAEDPDNELAWYILFTGLKAPLTAFWLDGRVHCPSFLGTGGQWSIPVRRGLVDMRLVRSSQPRIEWPSAKKQNGPFAARLLVAVLGNLAIWPAAIIHVFHPILGMDDPLSIRLKNLLSLPAYQVVSTWYLLRGVEDDHKGFGILRRVIAWFEREREKALAARDTDEVTREALDDGPQGVSYWIDENTLVHEVRKK